MVQVTVEQAVSELGRLLEEVGRGEGFVIVQGDAPPGPPFTGKAAPSAGKRGGHYHLCR